MKIVITIKISSKSIMNMPENKKLNFYNRKIKKYLMMRWKIYN